MESKLGFLDLKTLIAISSFLNSPVTKISTGEFGKSFQSLLQKLSVSWVDSKGADSSWTLSWWPPLASQSWWHWAAISGTSCLLCLVVEVVLSLQEMLMAILWALILGWRATRTMTVSWCRDWRVSLTTSSPLLTTSRTSHSCPCALTLAASCPGTRLPTSSAALATDPSTMRTARWCVALPHFPWPWLTPPPWRASWLWAHGLSRTSALALTLGGSEFWDNSTVERQSGFACMSQWAKLVNCCYSLKHIHWSYQNGGNNTWSPDMFMHFHTMQAESLWECSYLMLFVSIQYPYSDRQFSMLFLA